MKLYLPRFCRLGNGVNINLLLLLLHLAANHVRFVFLNRKSETDADESWHVYDIELILAFFVLDIFIELLKPTSKRTPALRVWTVP
jgi:hypothetical protein